MGFKEALSRAAEQPPLMFEPVPPPKDTTAEAIDQHLDALKDALGAIPDVAGVNVPQIVGGTYETVDALDYSAAVQERTGLDVLVNKIVALEPPEKLGPWIQHAVVERNVRHVILVGGESSAIDYPGPSVTQANRIVANLDGATADTIGNICIPFRRRPGADEPDRMAAKTAAGADHFTSQIVLEPTTTRRLLRDYDRACRHAGITPATVFIGLAPVTDARDLKLMKSLGVEIPPHIERDLLWDDSAIAERSLELNLGILRRVLAALREEHIQVPVGLNVEQVSLRNWDDSITLAREAQALLQEHNWIVSEPAMSAADTMRTASAWQ